jgi:hypothetical protein
MKTVAHVTLFGTQREMKHHTYEGFVHCNEKE